MNPTSPKAANDFRFSRDPEVWKSEIESHLSRLSQNDDTAKKPLIDFINHRLSRRYLQPLMHIYPPEFKSGFLVMAASCLAIETLESFFKGLDNTEGVSKQTFIDFFERNKGFFPGFRECFPIINHNGKQTDTFYRHIRCGILHQAETTGGYSILRNKSSLFDKDEKSVNANKFIKALEDCLNKYIEDLRLAACNSSEWTNASKKITYICKNCES
jgi:hypothetical protein